MKVRETLRQTLFTVLQEEKRSLMEKYFNNTFIRINTEKLRFLITF